MTPPPPTGVDGTTDYSGTDYRLDSAEKKDSGRGFELFYVNGHVGGSYINMQGFSGESLGLEKSSAGGPSFGLGAGLRLVVFTIGPRARYHALSSFNMWQLGGELGFKIPVSAVDIFVGAHGGYAFVGRLGDATVATQPGVPSAADAVRVRGFNAGLDFAVDYYITSLFSVGAGIEWDFLYLKRPPAPLPAGITPEQAALIQADPLYAKSGTSAGLGVGGGLRLGLHFDI